MALDNNYTGLTKLKDWWGKVKANFTYLDNRISTIITTPAEGVSAQEIIDARKGETALGDKIDAMDAAHASHLADNAIYLTKYCVLDGAADDSTGLEQAVIDAKEQNRGLYLPSDKNLRITREVDLRGVRYIEFLGTITVDFNGNGLIVGGSSSEVIPYVININEVITPQNGVGVQIMGLKNGLVKIQYCPYLQLYADTDDAIASGLAYSYFYLGNIETLELNTNPSPVGSTTQWINENIFIGGRYKNIIIDGTYGHNGNIFIKPLLEVATITINKGHSNKFTDCRFEGACTINFATRTHNNIITQQWNSNARSGFYLSASPVVNDNGYNNLVYRSTQDNLSVGLLLAIDERTKIFNNSGDFKGDKMNLSPGLFKHQIKSSSGLVYESDLIPVDDEFGIVSNSDTALWRLHITVYDANGNIITTEPLEDSYLDKSSGWTFTSGLYRSSTTPAASIGGIMVKNPDGQLKYVKIGIGTTSSTGGQWFGYLVLALIYPKSLIRLANHCLPKYKQPVASEPVTKGFAQLGELVSKATGGVYTCTKSIDQTLSATAASGATSVSVTDVTGIEDGDIVGILLDDGKTDWRVVAGLSDNTFNVTALSGQASAGNRIVFNKWV